MTRFPLSMAQLAALSLGALMLVTSLAAQAEEEHRGGARRGRRVEPIASYVQECGDCHTPFQPGQLPAASWQRLMGGLDKHFGNNASVEPAKAREIGAWLQANAGPDGLGSPPQDRISRSSWFVRTHDEVGPNVWKRASIKSAANCSACHGDGAAQGRFNEHDVRIPRS
ncbi:MAG: diheme cytochrome c [Leptothrix sp. (in: b-proteobacteria)]